MDLSHVNLRNAPSWPSQDLIRDIAAPGNHTQLGGIVKGSVKSTHKVPTSLFTGTNLTPRRPLLSRRARKASIEGS